MASIIKEAGSKPSPPPVQEQPGPLQSRCAKWSKTGEAAVSVRSPVPCLERGKKSGSKYKCWSNMGSENQGD